jgi:hypothetical protein
MRQLVDVLLALAPGPPLTLQSTAALIRTHCGIAFSKQALSKRISANIDRLLFSVTTILFGSLPSIKPSAPSLKSFGRVLVQDSTTIPLPDQFSEAFPGSKNQHKAGSSLKVQLVLDLLSNSIPLLSISGFTRNDQAASTDILSVASQGDLVLRDLGYFTSGSFASMIERGIFFLSRFHYGSNLLDPTTKETLKLAKILRGKNKVDQPVLLGKAAKLPVRLVAIPVPEAVANQRRRNARKNRDKRLNPTKDKLFLMGWTIFITNIDLNTCDAAALDRLYRLRWSIEIVFKAWKSHLKLEKLNYGSESLLRVSIASRLLACALSYRITGSLEACAPADQQVSILRVAKVLSECTLLIMALLLKISAEDLLQTLVTNLTLYEKRPDRINLQQRLQGLG